jgi:hypothetical protein
MSGVPFGTELARPRTRRQVMRAALAGAALTLPLARGVNPARAAGPHDCQKGCLYTADRRVVAQTNACSDSWNVAWLLFLIRPVDSAFKLRAASRCWDRALLRHKASSFDCGQAGCPGFDPSGPDGPCDGCRDHCCTCQASPNGYICCVFDCDDPDHQCCPGG